MALRQQGNASSLTLGFAMDVTLKRLTATYVRRNVEIYSRSMTVTKPVIVLLCMNQNMALGCSFWSPPMNIWLSHDVLSIPQQRFSDHIILQKEVDDRRGADGRIGHQYYFGLLPFEGVVTTKPVGIEIVMQVKEALESVGYHVTLTDVPYSDPLPAKLLKIQINELYFKNCGLHFFTWGNISLTLTLTSHEGKVLFVATAQEDGQSMLGGFMEWRGFTEAVKKSLTGVLNQIVTASSTEEFRQALRR